MASQILENPAAVAAVAAVAGAAGVALIAPSALPMFPPQGLPQPSASGVPGGGGGFAPAAALSVCKIRIKLVTLILAFS